MALVDNYGSELIKWPQRPALRNTTEKSEDMKGVLDVVGAAHGTHISTRALWASNLGVSPIDQFYTASVGKINGN